MQPPPRGITRRRCGLLPNNFGHWCEICLRLRAARYVNHQNHSLLSSSTKSSAKERHAPITHLTLVHNRPYQGRVLRKWGPVRKIRGALPCLSTVAQLLECLRTQSCPHQHVQWAYPCYRKPVKARCVLRPTFLQFSGTLDTVEIWQDSVC